MTNPTKMAQPTAASVDPHVWIACAAPLSRLPAVGSQVYYFPHGHAEQCPAPLPDPPLPQPYIFPCTVHAVHLLPDTNTEEPYATITLSPGPHRYPTPDAQPLDTPPGFCFYAKQLTQSDANNGGGFSVPRSCADDIFPRLDFEADPPVQNLRMRDLLGNHWTFRHIYRGTPRRHLFTTGWTKFVNAKLLVAGDTVVFIRRPDGELIAGLRRTPCRYSAVSESEDRNSRARVPPQEVMDSVRHATNGDKFTVTYYPRQGAGEFVVPRKEVEEALNGTSCWLPGVQVRMKATDAEGGSFEWINGVVKAVDSSIWRMLEVEWDIGESPTKQTCSHVSPWQIQLVGYPPLLKRLRISQDVAMTEPLVGWEGSHVPAGIQGARHTVLSSSSTVFKTELDLFPKATGLPIPPSSSEVMNPETESPPKSSANMVSAEFFEEVKSIQLFGTTITSRMHCDTNGSSAQVNQVPNAVVDETANEDASAPSPLDGSASKDADSVN